VTRVASIFSSDVALLEKRSGQWRLVGSSGTVPAVHAFVDALTAAQSTAGVNGLVFDVSIDRIVWTSLMLGRRDVSPLALFVRGDWRTMRPLLRDCAQRLTGALERQAARTTRRRHRRVATALALPERLAREHDESNIHQLIVDTAAQAVGTRVASVAIYDPERRSLAVVATYGYAAVLVRHLRILPGTGVIGSVFRSARPLCVADTRQLHATAPPRRRYQTRSFVAVPLPGAAGPLGVLCVSDRLDGRVFDRRDQRALQRIAAVASLALERAQAQQQARASAQVAAVDVLTSLFNRRHFQARLEEEVERARRQGSSLTLLLIDIDKLKQVNDRLGHPAGDAVLRLFGDVLHRLVRVFDVCARVGGDEFAVLMPGSGAEDSRLIAERIREGIEDSRPAGVPWTGGGDLRVSASIGIATFDGTMSELLVTRADEALYSAKVAGGNRVHMHGVAPA
jgi:diguanylate cyclase (GGDEF)-like protein